MNIKKITALFLAFTFCIALYSETIINNIYNDKQIIPSPKKPSNRPSVALVLSGGGARGFAHLPILELLQEYEIPIDIVIGTSVGSIIGGMYSAGYSVDEMKEIFFSLNWNDIFNDKTYEPFEKRLNKHSSIVTPISIGFAKISDKNSLSLGAGLLTGQYAYELIKKHTLAIPSNIDFNTLPTPFRSVGVNLLTGDVEVFTSGDLAEAIRASMSIPGFFLPTKIGENYYVDGGARDNTPIDVAVKMGYDIIIVSEISTTLVDSYDKFTSHPITALQQMITMEQYDRNKSMYEKTSLTMFPDYGSYSIFDFMKSDDIYKISSASTEKYRNELQKIKEQIQNSSTVTKTSFPTTSSQLANVALDNSPSDSSLTNPSFSNSHLPKQYIKNNLPIAKTLSIIGGDDNDKKLIEKRFSNLKDKELTKETYELFEKSIYKLGKYDAIFTRITPLTREQAELLDKIDIPISTTIEESEKIAQGQKSATIKNSKNTKITAQKSSNPENFANSAQINKFKNPTNSNQTHQSHKKTNWSNIEIILTKKKQQENIILFGGEYEGTFSNKSTNNITLTMEFQKRNLLKKGAKLSLQTHFLTDHSIALKYNYPIGSLAFAELNWQYKNDRTLISGGYEYHSTQTTQLIKHQADFSLGFPLTDWFLYLAGIGIGSYNSEDFIKLGEKTDASSIFSEITINTLDSPTLATKGVYLSVSGTEVIPLNNVDTFFAYDIENFSFTGIFPLTPKFSISIKNFVGLNYFESLLQSAELIQFFGFPLADRSFFPHLADATRYGLYKIAFGGSLQFCPKEQLTLLGGKALFAISGTIGNSWVFKEDINTDAPIWRSSLDVGIHISNNLGMLLRCGFGKSDDRIRPFISFDLGKVNF